jgi:hypothetical protein
MKDIVIDTFDSIKQKVTPKDRKNGYEFLGYDFIIDDDLKVWLLSINTGETVFENISCNFYKEMTMRFIDESLQIVVDPLYPPNDEYKKKSLVKKRGFDLIYSENEISNHDYVERD